MDYDDLGVGVHPSACAVPAAVAVAEEIGKINGRELITAVAVAVDLSCRMGLAISGSRTNLAIGRSGLLTYGGGIKILPNKNNVCVVEPMSLIKLFKSKKLLFNGHHGVLQEVSFYDCKKVVVEKCAYKIPFQFDGEALWLHPWEFPLVFEQFNEKIKMVTKRENRIAEMPK